MDAGGDHKSALCVIASLIPKVTTDLVATLKQPAKLLYGRHRVTLPSYFITIHNCVFQMPDSLLMSCIAVDFGFPDNRFRVQISLGNGLTYECGRRISGWFYPRPHEFGSVELVVGAPNEGSGNQLTCHTHLACPLSSYFAFHAVMRRGRYPSHWSSPTTLKYSHVL